MPVKNHLGIPPSYWNIFVEAINNVDEFYKTAFGNIVEHMNIFVLTRYPDIRIKLTALLNNKPDYKDFLRKISTGLHTELRNNANAILLTCFPDREPVPLKNIVSGFFRSASGIEEWQSFCLGLNYSKEALDQLYQQLGSFVEGSKTYALLLLYYHKYHLTENEIEEMVKGLLGPAYFMDRKTIRLSDSSAGILSEPGFFDKIIPYLNNPQAERAERAALTLLDYHNAKLNGQQRAIAWTLQIESYEQSFFDFALKHEDLLQNEAFVESVIEYAAQTGKETLLAHYCKTQKDPTAWKVFFIRFIAKAERFHADLLLELHNWLISHTNKFPGTKTAIAATLTELLQVPAYTEHKYQNNIYQFLLLIADEFEVADKSAILASIEPGSFHINEELLLALALRANFTIPGNYLPSGGHSYMTLFTPYQPWFIENVQAEKLERLLVDTENLPAELLSITGQVILYGQLSAKELEVISEKNILGAYFSMLVNFCRNQPVHIEKMIEIREIGGVKTYQVAETKVHRGIIKNFFQYLLSEKANRDIYINTLKAELDKLGAENVDEYLLELIAYDERIEFKNIEKLLDLLLDRPYLLKKELAYYLSGYFANNISAEEKPLLKEAIENFLSAISNHFEREGSAEKYNLILWLFSLALLSVTDDVPDIARDSFLLGLRYVFLEKNSIQRALHNPPEILFKAGDLFHYTNTLFAKIDATRIKRIIEYGTQSNVPEISSCCRILNALSGK